MTHEEKKLRQFALVVFLDHTGGLCFLGPYLQQDRVMTVLVDYGRAERERGGTVAAANG